MITVRTIPEIRRVLVQRRAEGAIGFVPTMGALHAGHTALIAASRADCDVTVVSIFVNPAQFNDPADLAAYPRDLDRDAEVALAARADVLFCPSPDDMYPADFSSWVDVAGPAVGLEGERRPGHFRGVATVCLKLFSIVQPDRAYFGQKDAQQVAVIRQMVRDLNLPLAVHVIPTVREPDGLALSSRNVRLSPIDRGRAAAIWQALVAGKSAHAAGHDPVTAARSALDGFDLDYVDMANLDGRPTLVIAVRVGGTRLIDNIVLDE